MNGPHHESQRLSSQGKGPTRVPLPLPSTQPSHPPIHHITPRCRTRTQGNYYKDLGEGRSEGGAYRYDNNDGSYFYQKWEVGGGCGRGVLGRGLNRIARSTTHPACAAGPPGSHPLLLRPPAARPGSPLCSPTAPCACGRRGPARCWPSPLSTTPRARPFPPCRSPNGSTYYSPPDRRAPGHYTPPQENPRSYGNQGYRK